MATRTATAPAPAPGTPITRAPVLFGRIDLNEPRNLAGLAVMAFCLGVMAGARLMRGAIPPAEPGQPQPCADCAERAIQAERAARAAARPQPAPTAPQPAPAPPTVPERVVDPSGDEDAARAATVAAQLMGTADAPRKFSPYAESVLPAEHVVSNGDSSIPVGE